MAQGYSCGEVARLLGDAPRADWDHRFEEWGLSGLREEPRALGELLSELQRLDHEAKLRDDPKLRADPKLRYRAWKFLDDLGETLRADPVGLDRAIETYRLMAALEGFSDKRPDVFYKLNAICAVDPNRKAAEEQQLFWQSQSKGGAEQEPPKLPDQGA